MTGTFPEALKQGRAAMPHQNNKAENQQERIGKMLVEIKKLGKEKITATTSLDVADTFGKEHRRVLQDIRELGCSEEFRLHHFVQSSYENVQGKNQPMYLMTRDGFVLLVMGYTGDLAMKFKEAYIKQFNAMEMRFAGKRSSARKGLPYDRR